MSPSNYPAAVAYIVNLIMAVIVSFGFLSTTASHDIATAVVALTSLIVVFAVRPIAVAAATGAFQTFIVAVSGFGFHLTDAQLASVIGVFGLAVALVTHQLVIPVSAARKGTTVAAQQSGARR